MKTVVQCDFDGTITEEDVSFLILEKYSTQDWHPWLDRYKEGKISVGEFNTRIFAMVTTGRRTLINFVRNHARIRPGFVALLDFCKQRDFEFIIVSNGLDFYIDFIMNGLGINNMKIVAAKTEFSPHGMKVKYIGPDGSVLMDKFKEAYTKLYTDKGYNVIYIGNGLSDLPSAQLAYRVFARDELTDCCKQAGIPCTPFEDLNDVVRNLDGLTT